GNANFLPADPVEQIFVIRDLEPPVITLIGSEVIYHEAATSYEDEGASASDSLEGDLSDDIVMTNAVNVNEVGSYEVNFNLTDANGNDAVAVSRLVIIEDTTAPTITVLNGESLPWNQPAAEGQIVTEENEEGEPSMTLEISFPVPVRASGLGLPAELPLSSILQIEAIGLDHEESLVVWHNDGENENNSSTNQEYDDPLENESSGNEENNATFADEINIQWDAIPFLTSHLHLLLKSDALIPDEALTDNVVLFAFVENAIILEAGDSYEEPGFIAMDTLDGNLTDHVVTIHDLNVLVPGDYHLEYEVSDAAGNLNYNDRLVRVVDHTAPIIAMHGEAVIQIPAGHSYEDLGATAMDIVDGNLTDHLVVHDAVDVEFPGIYEVIYLVSDVRGNVAKATREVVVMNWDPQNLNIRLHDDQVIENGLIGAVVGHFTATKPGLELPHQFHLKDGSGSEDNHLFSIEDGQLQLAGSIDFEKMPILSIRVQSVSANGALFQKVFTIQVQDAQAPSLTTMKAGEISESSAELFGELISDGGNPILRVGFELSEKPFEEASPDNTFFIAIESGATGGQIHALADGISPETDYYYRALAENAEGVTYGESKTFRTNNASALYGAVEIEGRPNWINSDWFGEVYRTSTPWLFHSELGWLYFSSDDQYSIWFWSKELGWVWTTADVYPDLYRFADGAWLNFAFVTDAKRIFYNYLTESWELYDTH
ncbi:MAG: DUF5011 domain-containing protein, partial [Opitutales bacterium]